MKLQKMSQVWFGVILALMSSCQLLPEQTQTAGIASPVTATATIRPPVATHTPYVPPNFTPYPTLTLDTQTYYYTLLKNNGGCDFPCFLGIVPGQTKWQDANLFLEEFALIKPITPDSFASSSSSTEYFTKIITNYEINLHGTLQTSVDLNGIVQHVVFTVEISKGSTTETHDKHLSWYSLSNIFRNYGAPDEIYFNTTKTSLGYSFDLLYDKRKFIIGYSSEANLLEDGSFRYCPNIGYGDVSSIKFATTSANYPIDVKTLIGYPFWEGVPPFEEVSGMSVNDFYKLMTTGDDSVCFQIKH